MLGSNIKLLVLLDLFGLFPIVITSKKPIKLFSKILA